MSRIYQGIDLAPYAGLQLRNMREIHNILRDLSSSVSQNFPALPETPGAAPNTVDFVTITNTDKLSAERALAVTLPATLNDGGADSTVTIGVNVGDSSFDRFLRSNEDDSYDTTGKMLTFVSGTTLTLTAASLNLPTGAASIAGAGTGSGLDADLLDGLDSLAFVKADGTVPLTADWDAGAFEIRAETFESDVTTGTAPFTVASTTVVTNLNADTVDGIDSSSFLRSDAADVYNDAAADIDLRMEGTGEANLFFLNAGSDGIGIGTIAPTNSFEVATATMKLKQDNTNFNFFAGAFVFDVTEGSTNVGIGYEAGRYNQTGGGSEGTTNVYIGTGAGKGVSGGTSTGRTNVAVGDAALTAITSGADNICLGSSAGTSITSGGFNVALGSAALLTNATSSNNMAIGGSALRLCTGAKNVGIGASAGFSISTGAQNVVIGSNAMEESQTGSANVMIGNAAGQGVASNSYERNVCIGESAAKSLQTGSRNVHIGYLAGFSDTTGGNNICIGYQAGDDNVTTGGSNIIIGNDLEPSAAGVSSEVNIGGILFGNRSNTDVGVVPDAQFSFDAVSGAALGDTFLRYDSGAATLDCFVDNTEVWNATSTEVNFVAIPALKNGIESRYYDVGDSNYTGFKAPALTGNQIYTLPTGDGADGDVLTTNGAGDLSWLSGASEKAWTFTSPAGSSGVFYVGGFYDFHSTSFTPAGGTNVGTANSSYAAHALVVLGAGSTDMVVRVTGTSITDTGTRAAADTEDIDTSAGSAGDYYETSKKWIGLVSYTLLSGTGVVIDAGFAKYWDNNNTDFAVTGLEVTWLAGASDSAPDIELLHHTATGWTYSGGGGTPTTPTALASMNTDHSTESETVNGDPGAWKRTNLSTNVDGASSEGTIWRITTSANKAFEIGNILMRITPQ